jgi:mRNA interferase MazF
MSKDNPLHTKEERRVHMDLQLQRYDIIKAEIKYKGMGSVQTNERPYVIISNPIGTKHATIITVMALTSKIKKLNMPVHSCIHADNDNGLTEYSMALGEQLFTISKEEVKEKLGTVTSKEEKKLIDKACFNGLFYGTEYRLEEVNA